MLTNISICLNLIILLIIIDQSNCNKTCSQDVADGCFNTLMMVGDNNFKFPESTTELQAHCRLI